MIDLFCLSEKIGAFCIFCRDLIHQTPNFDYLFGIYLSKIIRRKKWPALFFSSNMFKNALWYEKVILQVTQLKD
jgi:hypothetical protein